jgi:hypothetical protein
VRLDVNGAPAASIAVGVRRRARPTRIGGNSPYGEYFRGIIDEARVYSRAVSATEIQTIMNNRLSRIQGGGVT